MMPKVKVLVYLALALVCWFNGPLWRWTETTTDIVATVWILQALLATGYLNELVPRR